MKKKQYLFVAGPMHAQWLDVEATPAVDPTASPLIDVLRPEPADDDDLFPDVVVNLEHATHYTRRTVSHVANDTGNTWQLRVYVWEGIHDPNTAQMYLGDAVAHRYFIEHGTVVGTASPAVTRIIVPGR